MKAQFSDFLGICFQHQGQQTPPSIEARPSVLIGLLGKGRFFLSFLSIEASTRKTLFLSSGAYIFYFVLSLVA